MKSETETARRARNHPTPGGHVHAWAVFASAYVLLAILWLAYRSTGEISLAALITVSRSDGGLWILALIPLLLSTWGQRGLRRIGVLLHRIPGAFGPRGFPDPAAPRERKPRPAGETTPPTRTGTFDPHDVVRRCLQRLEPVAQRDGNTLLSRIHDNVPHRLAGEDRDLSRMIEYLVRQILDRSVDSRLFLDLKTVEQKQSEVLLRIEIGRGDTLDAPPARDRGPLAGPDADGLDPEAARELVSRLGGQLGADRQAVSGQALWFTAIFRKHSGLTEKAVA